MALSKGVSSNSGKKAESIAKEFFGMVLILFAVLAFFCLVTGNALVYPLGGNVQSFLLGIFGVYSFLFLLHVGLLGFRLVSGKSLIPVDKRLAFFLITLAIVIIFFIVHLAVGFDNSLAVGEHMSLSFEQGKGGFSTTTPGGALATLLTASIAKIASYPGTFVILSIALLVVLAVLFKDRFSFERDPSSKRQSAQKKYEEVSPSVDDAASKQTGSNVKGVEPVEVVTEIPHQGYFLDEKSPFVYKSKREATSGVPSRLSIFGGKFEFKNPYQSTLSSRNPVCPESQKTYSEDYTVKNSEPSTSKSESPGISISEAIRTGATVGRVGTANTEVPSSNGLSSSFKQDSAGDIDCTRRSAYVVNESSSQDVHVVDRTERDNLGSGISDTRSEYGTYDRTADSPMKRSSDSSFVSRTTGLNDSRHDFRSSSVGIEKDSSSIVRGASNGVEHPQDDFSATRKPVTPSFSSTPRDTRSFSSTASHFSTQQSDEKVATKEPERQSPFTPRVETSPMGSSSSTASTFSPKITRDIVSETKKSTPPADETSSIEDMPVDYKYNAPPLNLLKDYNTDPKALQEENEKRKVNSETIIRVIKQSTGIDVTIENIIAGPSVTRYDIAIPDDVSPKDIFQAKADLAFRLKSSDMRMYNVPNESLIGIELPNKVVSIVGLKSVLSSPEYKQLKKKGLQFVLGKNILGKSVVLDLARMPHLLVSGATGMGKSVCLSSLLISLLYRYSPAEMRLIIIDPKIVEFNKYKGIPHLVFNDIIGVDKRALAVLEWAVGEMDRRYQFLADNICTNIGEYNDMIDTTKDKRIPYIVILIDEFAELIMADEGKNKKKIENYISRLAQKARAAGISLILATQRPSVDVISGTIKTNVASRICFKTASSTDSRVVIDENGAEKLVCKGDCFYKTSDEGFLQRAQGSLIENSEVQSVLDYIRKNNECYYDDKVLELINSYATEDEEGSNEDTVSQPTGGEVDEVMKKALRIVIDQRRVSNSALRTKLGIGYNRAATIVEWMTKMKYVSAALDNKDRAVLITREQYVESYGDFIEDF